MKIEGPRAPENVGAPRKAGGAGGAGFTLPAEEAGAPAKASGVRPPTALGGLFELQGQTFDPNRRARQVRRAAKTLDTLEALARAHLDGAAPHAQRLGLVALQSQGEPTGDPGLDSVLDDIDVRAAVELAKLEVEERRSAHG
jgi:hypothetical protein